jgi:hypothetical protein
MTTIFADHKAGVMVCDSKCTDSRTWHPITKVFRVGDELVGMAGEVREGRAWLKWYQSGKRGVRPKLDEFVAISLRKDGVYEHCSDGLELLIERGFHGIGSGGAMAIAAYMAGADAVKSVHIAIAIDAGSGGEVHTHKFKK